MATVGAIVGATFEPDIVARPLAAAIGVAAALLLLFRRQHPLAALLTAFGIQGAADVATLAAGTDPTLVVATALMGVVFTFSLVRWGAGTEVALGLAFVVGTQVLTEANVDGANAGGYFASLPFLMLPAAVGGVMRYRDNAQRQGIEEARAGERQLLARELHDTVAHHVSAIAIQAQAGQTLAGSNPEAAAQVLGVIEEAASRTLADMRRMVGALRDAEPASLVPQAGLAEIERMVGDQSGAPRIDLQVSGDLADLSPSVEAGLYRLTQESITNARRHARHATCVSVSIDATDTDITLRVADDGDAGTSATASGFGLVGMAERASLLGGTMTAGPAHGRGWVVTAVLPRLGGSVR